MKPAPFSRYISMVAVMQSLLGSGLSFMAAAMQSGADSYRSRGKGRGSIPGKTYHRRGKRYPFSSHKQHNKAARTQRMVMQRNGHEIMQTLSSQDRDHFHAL